MHSIEITQFKLQYQEKLQLNENKEAYTNNSSNLRNYTETETLLVEIKLKIKFTNILLLISSWEHDFF